MRITGRFSILLLATWFFALAGFAQPNGGSCRITGKIQGFRPGSADPIKVEAVVLGKPLSFDATPKADGSFELAINQPSPTAYRFTAPGIETGEPVMFFCDHGSVDVQVVSGKPAHVTVKGGPSQKEWDTYNGLIRQPDREMQELSNIWEKLSSSGQLSGKEDSLRQRYAALSNVRENAIRQWLSGNRDSYVAPFVIAINYLSNGTGEVLEPLYTPLSQRVKESYYGNAVGERVQQMMATTIGQEAPDFMQADPNGKSISLASLRGKFVLVDFWASWCGPCRQENPNLVRTYQQFKDKLVILGVSLDQKRELWLKAIEDDKLTWLHVSDLNGWSNAVAVQYGINSIPANFLLDPSGKIIAKGLRGQQLDARLSELIR